MGWNLLHCHVRRSLLILWSLILLVMGIILVLIRGSHTLLSGLTVQGYVLVLLPWGWRYVLIGEFAGSVN